MVKLAMVVIVVMIMFSGIDAQVKSVSVSKVVKSSVVPTVVIADSCKLVGHNKKAVNKKVVNKKASGGIIVIHTKVDSIKVKK